MLKSVGHTASEKRPFTVDSAVQVQPINHKGHIFFWNPEYKEGNSKHINEN